jgi:hypothetical protein
MRRGEDIPARRYDARMIAREEDQPFCPEGDFRFWASVGAAALGAYVLGCLAGFAPLIDAPGPEFTLIQRLSAAGAAAVWVALCAGAGSLGFAAVSLVRGRPPGSGVDIASRAFACVAVASLCRFVPVGIPALKVAFDSVATAVAAAVLARAAYRIAPLEAAAATAVGTGVLAALASVAFVVTWAVRPA